MMQLDVVAVHDLDTYPTVRQVVLAAPDGARLPSYAPGAHLYLDCCPDRTAITDGDAPAGPPQIRNAYSLTGPGDAPLEYRISVALDPIGRGGSRWVHEQLQPGHRLQASEPRCTFSPVHTARRSVYVAGGIGVTPLVSHVIDACRRQRDFEFVYVTRHLRAPHLEQLRDLCGDRLTHLIGRQAAASQLADLVLRQPVGTYLYVCGPTPFTDDVTATAARAGWPAARIRSERFVGAELDPGDPFDVVLARSGRRLRVPAGTSLLECLLAAGVDLPNMCRRGVCGQCRTPVRAGTPVHHDFVLDEAERAAGKVLMSCVSRASTVLELDL